MKAVLIIVVAVVAMALLGWITFGSGDRPTVTVQTDVIRKDTQSAAAATRRAAEKAQVEGERLVDEARRTDIDVDVRRDPVAAER